MNDILFNVADSGCATLTLNKEATHNAFDDTILCQLQDHLNYIVSEKRIRLLILKAKGKSFSSGANLNWMKKMANYTEDENFQDAMAMAKFFKSLSSLPIPTLAVVQGAALGGGLGLVAACDIVLASSHAIFGMPEVRLGLLPAVIFPYVVKAIGQRAAQAYGLTGEVFDGNIALRLGLIHQLVSPEELDKVVLQFTDKLLSNGSSAMFTMKRELVGVQHLPEQLQQESTSRIIARLRCSTEGQEGVTAFLEKRKPTWNTS